MGTGWIRPAGRAAALGAVLFALAGMASCHAAPAPEYEGLGTTAEGLIAAARALSPGLRAAALTTAATAAIADSAGSLDDPTFTATSDEVDRTSGSRINKTYLTFTQEFPLWGKRDLRRSAALAAVDAARGKERAAQVELDERIKVAFARYYAVTQAIAINQEVGGLTRQMTAAAVRRYGLGVGDQTSAITTQTEETRTTAEQIRLEAARRTAVARLNALLARPTDTPLAKPVRARALPATDLAVVALYDRARSLNPRLVAGAAQIRGAASESQLAERAWYPDITLGAGAIQRDNGPPGYMASIAIRVPLQRGPKEAGEREASARLSAAKRELDAASAEIEGDLAEAVNNLNAARQTEILLRNRLLPQQQAVWRSLLAGYGQGRGDLAAVLEAEHRMHDTNIELLRIETDAQTALAAVERLIGGEL
jgi:cobalt-zinc-cadmium efflux system outer membrane protein